MPRGRRDDRREARRPEVEGVDIQEENEGAAEEDEGTCLRRGRRNLPRQTVSRPRDTRGNSVDSAYAPHVRYGVSCGPQLAASANSVACIDASLREASLILGVIRNQRQGPGTRNQSALGLA